MTTTFKHIPATQLTEELVDETQAGEKAVRVVVEEFTPEIPVQLTHEDDSPNPGDTHDSVRIGDGTEEVAVTAANALKTDSSHVIQPVSSTDLDIRDLTHVSDSVKVGDGTDFIAVNADGSLNVTDNGGSLTVDAANLDIRDLTHTADSVRIGDGTDFVAVNADGSLNITDNSGSLTVDATNLDIRDLLHTLDSIRIGDGTNLIVLNSNGSINVKRDPASTAAVTTITLTTTSQTVLSSNTQRKGAIFNNTTNRSVYLKYGAGASLTSYTLKIPSGATAFMPDPAYSGLISGIIDSGTGGLITTEVSI